MKDLRNARPRLGYIAAVGLATAWLLMKALIAAQAADPTRTADLAEALTAPLIAAPLPPGFGLGMGGLMALALYVYFHLFVRRR